MEIWKDVKGYEGLYQVSTSGNIKSLKREVSRYGKIFRTDNEKLLKLKVSNNKYLYIDLSCNGKKKRFLAHRLIAQTFMKTQITSQK